MLDVCCVLHLHTAVVSAVSSMKCGLLPICQEAMIIGPVAYHDYKGIVSDDEEKESIVRDFGDKNVMILRNHRFVACGQSVEDAFHTVIACETQDSIKSWSQFKSNGMAKNKLEFVETPKNKPPHPTLTTKQNEKVEKIHSENKGNPDSAIKDNLRNKTKLKRFFSLNKKRT